MKEILNLGAGVQSTCLALMSFEGELPRLDRAYFADTGWEPKAVYRHLEWLKGEFDKADVPLSIIQASSIRDDVILNQAKGNKKGGGRWGSLPFFVLNQDGTSGMVRRQCTSEYKIKPIERLMKSEVLGLSPNKWWPRTPVVNRWYGISIDEMQRMRTSGQKWAINKYPLIEKRMDRTACMKWMHDRGYPEPPRSACIGCPFHSNREWADMAQDRAEEFEDACQFDEAIRNANGFGGTLFLHAKRIPLRDIDFSGGGQLNLWPDECAGICGV